MFLGIPGNGRISKKEYVCPYGNSVVDVLTVINVGVPLEMILLPVFEERAITRVATQIT